MNKILTTAVLFLFVQSAIAQKGIGNLIQAEKDFAAWSIAHSTKEAFQKFIDSNSIMFDNGKPVKATEFWNKREKNAAVLNWQPQYAEISASGDFGYTTGPWTVRPTKDDTIVARGQYITVWHINKNGEWKFLVDLGVSNTTANTIEDVRIIDAPKEPETYLGNLHPLAAAESDFNQMLAEKKAKAYKTWLSGESILNRNGSLPAVNSTDRQNIIDSTPAGIKYTMNGMGSSAVPDMGYTYGTTVINDKSENYLRIWRREGSGWKIAVEVLRY
ncbi:MAG TPA: nuclear transport factor 2 family protein [Chitinophagaceae bacterium]|nr:nuclear transport factor 2 family protein [Chitinophagaceae bacterium]